MNAEPNAPRELVDAALAALRAGKLVAFPTDTVFALACRAFDEEAVGRLRAVKGRPEDKPLPLLVTGEEMARTLADPWPPRAADLARRFWPGPLTLVVPRAAIVPAAATAGAPTVGVRCPDHPFALALLRAMGEPLAAPSANKSGDAPALTADDARRAFPEASVLVIDAPHEPHEPHEPHKPRGAASTVLYLGERPEDDRVLREGPVSARALGAQAR